MIRLDEALLAELGLEQLPASEKPLLLKHLYVTLETRVGRHLASLMTGAQLDEFEAFIDAGDEGGGLEWLQTNMPDYKRIVQDIFGELKSEVAASATGILAAAQNAPSEPAPAS